MRKENECRQQGAILPIVAIFMVLMSAVFFSVLAYTRSGAEQTRRYDREQAVLTADAGARFGREWLRRWLNVNYNKGGNPWTLGDPDARFVGDFTAVNQAATLEAYTHTSAQAAFTARMEDRSAVNDGCVAVIVEAYCRDDGAAAWGSPLVSLEATLRISEDMDGDPHVEVSGWTLQ